MQIKIWIYIHLYKNSFQWAIENEKTSQPYSQIELRTHNELHTRIDDLNLQHTTLQNENQKTSVLIYLNPMYEDNSNDPLWWMHDLIDDQNEQNTTAQNKNHQATFLFRWYWPHIWRNFGKYFEWSNMLSACPHRRYERTKYHITDRKANSTKQTLEKNNLKIRYGIMPLDNSKNEMRNKGGNILSGWRT